ncbi:MAG: LysR family transcriptional regulator [Acidobacteria bacterium]|nr:MAG: LysR family transcriptional regulator [Acidobacteriota bacterium]
MVLPEIRLLQAAIALAEELNYSRAAKRLRIDQSTLSKRIMELEELVGLRLFERNHQVVELTEPGRHFVQEARHALLHAERAVSSATAALRGADEVLNLGRSAYIDPYLVSTLLSIHLPLFPGLKIKQWSNYSHELAHQVALGKLDMALITAIPDTPKLNLLVVADTPIYIALSRDNPLRSNEELRLEDMSGQNWILPAPHVNPHLHEMIQGVSSERGVAAAEVHHVTTAEEASELILAHKGVAFMTRGNAWRIARDGVTMRPLAENRLRLVTKLATRADNKSRLVSEFVRAAGRKLISTRPAQQGRLPLAG